LTIETLKFNCFQRRVHTRGRGECSVATDAARRTTAKKVSGQIRMTVDGRIINVKRISEPRTPIEKKFTRKTADDKGGSSARKASVAELWMNEVAATGVRGIRKEFINDLKGYVPIGPQTAWECEKNYDKNRFEDIRLLDNTRVILRNTPDNEDYIHASYVKLDGDTVFICAQGPMNNTAQHFLIMIVQEGSKVIVLGHFCKKSVSVTAGSNQNLCTESVDRFLRCGIGRSTVMIPKNGSECEDYGAVRVRILGKPKHFLSLKKVTHTRIRITYAGVSHETEHILYTGWPDHSVPESVTVCKEVRNIVRKYAGKKPVIVHCGAGIGRSGAYVAAEMAINRLQRNEMLVMGELIKDLRDQRMGAIQNDQQYLFVFRMVIEVLVSEELLLKNQQVIDFIKEYDDLIKRKRLERARRSKT
uniref:Protein-tyrosine phosphatase n=1 Tax=Anisakis simplex TaxID=6269 RepID=A0A0M3K7G4_ANISI